MRKILFACDLDNTLIHSWKYRRDEDVCVEWIDGKEQGYMSTVVIAMLRRICKQVEFVPVTTRSVAQYQRIMWPEGCCPRFAITTHGASLLDNENENQTWKFETNLITSGKIDTLSDLVKKLEGTGEYIRCRLVDDSYAFVYCRNNESAVKIAMSYPLADGIYRIQSGKKVYFIPEGIDKGIAVKRFKSMWEFDTTICAGDSEMDVPMLQMGNISFAPKVLKEKLVSCGKIYICDSDDFAQEILKRIEFLIENSN